MKLADVKDPAQAAGLVAAAVDAFGRLDILVNNATVRQAIGLMAPIFGESNTRELIDAFGTSIGSAIFAN